MISIVSHIDKSNLYPFSISKIDTSITNFQNYFPRNTNGHLGNASNLLNLCYDSKPLGFKFFDLPFQNDIIYNADVKYLQTKGPYANLTGIAGSKSEQIFKLIFSQTFKNKLNLSLVFNRYSGLGFFKHQKSFTNNLYFSTNYTSKNNRVGYFGHYLYNKLKYDENGGISSDSLLLSNAFINKTLLPINQASAKRELRIAAIDFNPWYRINKKEDSSTVISHVIDYQFNFSGNYSKYTDAVSGTEGFYNVFYLDTISTKDSTHWNSIKNGLNYALKFNRLNAKIKLGYQNEINQVYQYLDTTFTNHIVNTGFYISKSNYLGFIKANFIPSGSNQNDYTLEIANRFSDKLPWVSIKNKGTIGFIVNLNAIIEKRHPDFIYNTWLSNHYAWNNNFASTDKQQAFLSVSTADNSFDIGVVYQSVKNLIYFNELAVPEQTQIGIQTMSAFIHKDLLLFKHLGISAKYNYQNSSYQSIVSLPNHIINGGLYFQGNLFKNALQIQIGFNAQYFREFYGKAYSTAINQYYVQTEKKTGNYPFVDFFLNARIKPVRIFVKLDHINQGFSGNNYILTPNYLQNNRALKFGVNWLFFD